MGQINREEAENYIRDALKEFVNKIKSVKNSKIRLNESGQRILSGLGLAKKTVFGDSNTDNLKKYYFDELSDEGLQTFLDKCKILTKNFNLKHYEKIRYLKIFSIDEKQTETVNHNEIDTKRKNISYTIFSQQMFTQDKGFKSTFSATACNATAALNVISKKYSEITGEVLSKNYGIEIMKSVIGNITEANIYIDETNAEIKDIASAVQSMANYINSKSTETVFNGRFWYSCRENEKIESIYKINIIKSKAYPKHFVNYLGDSTENENKVIVLDTYDGTLKGKDKSDILGANIFYYIVKKDGNNEN